MSTCSTSDHFILQKPSTSHIRTTTQNTDKDTDFAESPTSLHKENPEATISFSKKSPHASIANTNINAILSNSKPNLTNSVSHPTPFPNATNEPIKLINLQTPQSENPDNLDIAALEQEIEDEILGLPERNSPPPATIANASNITDAANNLPQVSSHPLFHRNAEDTSAYLRHLDQKLGLLITLQKHIFKASCDDSKRIDSIELEIQILKHKRDKCMHLLSQNTYHEHFKMMINLFGHSIDALESKLNTLAPHEPAPPPPLKWYLVRVLFRCIYFLSSTSSHRK